MSRESCVWSDGRDTCLRPSVFTSGTEARRKQSTRRRSRSRSPRGSKHDASRTKRARQRSPEQPRKKAKAIGDARPTALLIDFQKSKPSRHASRGSSSTIRALGMSISDPDGAAMKLADHNGVSLLSDCGKFVEKDSTINAVVRIRNGCNTLVMKLSQINWWEWVTLENILGTLKRCLIDNTLQLFTSVIDFIPEARVRRASSV